MNIVSLFIFCSALLVPKIASEPEQIRWQEDRKLSYADFQGAVPFSTPWAATTSSMIHFAYQTTNGTITDIAVYASFIPKKSWMKKRLPEVLDHEQVHFDITELFARRFYADAVKKTSASKEELNNLFRNANGECDKMQRQYDDETNHGTIDDQQAKWSKNVEEMLKSYDPYPVSQ